MRDKSWQRGGHAGDWWTFAAQFTARKTEIYQTLEPRLLLFFEGEADLCVNLQDRHFEKGSIVLMARDTNFEMKYISDDARVAVVIFPEG